MAIRTAPYWWVVCDRCGRRADYGDYAALADRDQAEEQADYGDWIVPSDPIADEILRDGEQHVCPNCFHAQHPDEDEVSR